jgi:hypothetical protein
LQGLAAEEKAIEKRRLLLRFRETVICPLHRVSSFESQILS